VSALVSHAGSSGLDLLRDCGTAWQRLADLEWAGRTLVTGMRSHMAEVAVSMSFLDYFKTFYTPVAAEFVQADDDGFVTHHCLRTLLGIWHAELDRLAAGPVGHLLAERALALPDHGSAVRAGRQPLARAWYEDVVSSLQLGGELESVIGNPVLPLAQTALNSRHELYFAQFLLWSTRIWARQVAVLWGALREIIALQQVAERIDVADLAAEIVGHQAEYRAALDRLSAQYREWRTTHIANVDIHDAIPRHQIYGAIGQWLADLGPHTATFTIKDCMKTEMYREVAMSVADLRGDPVRSEVPEFRYWRRTPWTPECLAAGQPGLPPFGG
jgi:hypothetical protein